MKKKIITFLFMLMCVVNYAQTSINAEIPNPNTLLEVANLPGETKGILIPRLTLEERDKLTYVDPAATPRVLRLTMADNSLLIFNTRSNRYNFWNGPKEEWFNLSGGYSGGFDLPDAEMTFDCTNDVIVTGDYKQSVALSEDNQNIVTFMVDVTKIGNYSIDVVSTNGYSFVATGTFLFTGKAVIRAIGSGTPKEGGVDTLVIRVNGKKSPCAPTINVRHNVKTKKMRVLYIGGEPITSMFKLSGNFLANPMNFGTLPSSIVQPSDGFEGGLFIYPTGNNYAELSKYLTKSVTNVPVDIVILGDGFNNGNNSTPDHLTNLLRTYFLNKGVVIVITGERNNHSNVERLLGGILVGDPVTGPVVGRVVKQVWSNKDNGYYPLPIKPGDPIVDGPFGNLGGKHIWLNGFIKDPVGQPYDLKTTKVTFDTTFVANKLVTFWKDIDYNDVEYYSMFYHKEYNLFYLGNSDVFENFYGAAWTSTFQAIPATGRYSNYHIDESINNPGNGVWTTGNSPMYNSILFGNIMNWAAQRAQTDGINTQP